MPPYQNADPGFWLITFIALWPIIKSIAEGFVNFINSRKALTTDAADKLSHNSLEWVNRFSEELKAAKERIDALEAEGKRKDERIDALEKEIAARDKKIAEMQDEIDRLQRRRRRTRKRGFLND